MNYQEQVAEHFRAQQFISRCENQLVMIANLIKSKLSNGNTIFIAGNGGSASDAQHFSAELIGRFVRKREPYRAICLNTDTSALTAIANDYGFEYVFKRQLKGLAKPGDLFIGITTSGKSLNILNAFEWCKNNDVETIALTGSDTTEAYHNICVPYTTTARIQEMHILIIHLLCGLIED